MRNPFRCFNSLPEIIRLTVMMYIRYRLSLRQVEDLLYSYSNWRWHLDEVFVRINGETHYDG
jgi:putative transposase